MGLPDQLYSFLTERDRTIQPLQVLHRFFFDTANSTQVTITTSDFHAQLPGLGHLVVLTHLYFEAIPGGALTLDDAEIRVFNHAESQTMSTLMRLTNDQLQKEMRCEIPLIMGQHKIYATGQFSASTSTNRLDVRLIGFVIPTGNAFAY